jgi:methenyltetrahydromethanopterin cyclohydrolase
MKDGSASLNDSAHRIADGMARDAERLRVAVSKGPLGERLINAGAKVTGSMEAGLLIAQAAMGGLGTVSMALDRGSP